MKLKKNTKIIGKSLTPGKAVEQIARWHWYSASPRFQSYQNVAQKSAAYVSDKRSSISIAFSAAAFAFGKNSTKGESQVIGKVTYAAKALGNGNNQQRTDGNGRFFQVEGEWLKLENIMRSNKE